MTERLSKEFIPALVDKAIKFHCRKGIRTWCECSFCQGKRRATGEMGSWFWIRANYDCYLHYRHVPRYPWMDRHYDRPEHFPNDYEIEFDHTIRQARELHRRVVRNRLATLQQEVLQPPTEEGVT